VKCRKEMVFSQDQGFRETAEKKRDYAIGKWYEKITGLRESVSPVVCVAPLETGTCMYSVRGEVPRHAVESLIE
jgi:hypothetical protein